MTRVRSSEIVSNEAPPVVADVRTGPGGRIRLLGRPKSRLLLSVPGNGAVEALDVQARKQPLEVTLRAR